MPIMGLCLNSSPVLIMNYYDGLFMGKLATDSEIKSLSLLTVCVCVCVIYCVMIDNTFVTMIWRR